MVEISIGKADLKPGTLRCVSVGGKKLTLANINGKYYCLQNECTHAGGPMCEGSLDKKDGIVCPWHKSIFGAKDGKVLRGPAIDPLKTYKVAEKNGEFYIDM